MADTPPKTTKVKICGIRTPEAMTAALENGADFIGLNFVPGSPRHVEIEVAAYLANYVPPHVKIVGLFADAPRQTMMETLANVRIDFIQLHGTETPDDCTQIAMVSGKPIIKALPSTQIDRADDYAAICDWLLVDAPAISGDLKGGGGQIFDWDIVKDFHPSVPWMLAGGLNAGNVARAIQTARPDAVDVSSGVESARGIKDPVRIKEFLQAARTAKY